MKIDYGIPQPDGNVGQTDFSMIRPGASSWSKFREDAVADAKAFNAWALRAGAKMFARVAATHGDDPEGAGWRAWFNELPEDGPAPIILVDPVRVWMDACLRSGALRYRSSKLYEDFERWAQGRFPASEVPHINFFTRALKEYGVEFKRRTDGWYALNVELRAPSFDVPMLSLPEEPIDNTVITPKEGGEFTQCVLCDAEVLLDDTDDDGNCSKCAAIDPSDAPLVGGYDEDASLAAKLEAKRKADSR